MDYTFGVASEKSFPYPRSSKLFPMLSIGHFIVLHFTFWSVIISRIFLWRVYSLSPQTGYSMSRAFLWTCGAGSSAWLQVSTRWECYVCRLDYGGTDSPERPCFHSNSSGFELELSSNTERKKYYCTKTLMEETYLFF